MKKYFNVLVFVSLLTIPFIKSESGDGPGDSEFDDGGYGEGPTIDFGRNGMHKSRIFDNADGEIALDPEDRIFESAEHSAQAHGVIDEDSLEDGDFFLEENFKTTILEDNIVRITTKRTTVVEGDDGTTLKFEPVDDKVFGLSLATLSLYIAIVVAILLVGLCATWRFVSVKKRKSRIRQMSYHHESFTKKSSSFRYSADRKSDPKNVFYKDAKINPNDVVRRDPLSPPPVYQETTTPIMINTGYGFPSIPNYGDPNLKETAILDDIEDPVVVQPEQNFRPPTPEELQFPDESQQVYEEIDGFMDSLGPRYR